MDNNETAGHEPKLLALLICEEILESPDKVVSLYRLVDTFNFGVDVIGESGDVERSGIVVPGENADLGFILNVTVLTKWGPGEGKFLEELRVLAPTGKESKGLKFEFTKPAGFHMQQINHQVQMPVKDGGNYAFRVYLNGELRGEHPFLVNINPPRVVS